MDEQWCLEYVVRSRDHRVRDVNKTPIMSLQVEDIGERALRKLRDSLTLRHEVAAPGASDVADAGDVGDGGDTGDGEGNAGDGGSDDDADLAGDSNSADEDSGNGDQQELLQGVSIDGKGGEHHWQSTTTVLAFWIASSSEPCPTSSG